MRKSMRQVLLKIWYGTKRRQPTRAPKSNILKSSRWLAKTRIKQVNLLRGYLFPHTQKTKASCTLPHTCLVKPKIIHVCLLS